MHSSNFWIPFTLWGIGLVASIYDIQYIRLAYHIYHIIWSFSDIWVDIYLFTYEANWVGKLHSFSMFSGFNWNLQYLDTVPSSDWMDCFLLPPLDWISSVGFGHSSTESQWGQWFHFSGPVVQQSSVLECWCFYEKYEKTLFIGITQSVSALHLRLQWERFIVTLNLRFQGNTFENFSNFQKTIQLTNSLKKET